jgi:hypothetical protein
MTDSLKKKRNMAEIKRSKKKSELKCFSKKIGGVFVTD